MHEKEMKIAVISDIHGNLPALKLALKNIEKENCDTIYCLGDLICGGEYNNETIELIKSVTPNIVLGNNDLAAIGGHDYGINSENTMFLKSLPKYIQHNYGNLKLIFVHGSPRNIMEGISPNSPLAEVEEAVSGTDADIIFCGHTHQPCVHRLDSGKTVVGTGSVSYSRTEDGKPYFAVLEIIDSEQKIFEVSHKVIS